VRWAGLVACVGDMKNGSNILVGIPEWKRALEDIGVDWRIILEWILGEYGGKVWSFCWPYRVRPSVNVKLPLGLDK